MRLSIIIIATVFTLALFHGSSTAYAQMPADMVLCEEVLTLPDTVLQARRELRRLSALKEASLNPEFFRTNLLPAVIANLEASHTPYSNFKDVDGSVGVRINLRDDVETVFSQRSFAPGLHAGFDFAQNRIYLSIEAATNLSLKSFSMQHELEHALTRKHFDAGIEDPYCIRAQATGKPFTSHMFYGKYYSFDELRAIERGVLVLSDRLLPENPKFSVALDAAGMQSAIALHLAKRSMILLGDIYRNRKNLEITYHTALGKTWALLSLQNGDAAYWVSMPLPKSKSLTDPENEKQVFARFQISYAIAKYKYQRFGMILNALDDARAMVEKHQNVGGKFMEIRGLLQTENEPKQPASVEEILRETEGLPVFRQP